MSIVDKSRNNVTLMEVIEAITFGAKQDIPDERFAFPLAAELVSFWIRDDFDIPERGRARILIFSPSGDVLNEDGFQYEVNLEDHARSRNMAKFGAVIFAGYGLYWYEVQSFDKQNEQWKEVAAIPLEIKIGEDPD